MKLTWLSSHRSQRCSRTQWIFQSHQTRCRTQERYSSTSHYHLITSHLICDLCPTENIITKVPDQRSPGRQHLRDHATFDRRAGGGEFRGGHQKHWAAAGQSGDMWWETHETLQHVKLRSCWCCQSVEKKTSRFFSAKTKHMNACVQCAKMQQHHHVYVCVRLCGGICQRRHRNTERSNRWRWCLSWSLHPHLYGFSTTLHLSHAWNHQF